MTKLRKQSSVSLDPRVFPTLLIVLNVAAAVVCAVDGTDWRKAVYWTSAAVLNYVVTW